MKADISKIHKKQWKHQNPTNKIDTASIKTKQKIEIKINNTHNKQQKQTNKHNKNNKNSKLNNKKITKHTTKETKG